MTEKKKVRIGFVGVGGMGQCAHLKNYAVLPDCEVAAIAEILRDKAHKVAARYGVAKVYADFRDMIAAEKLDALVASQPFTRHGVLIPELLKARVPVFIEKPVAGSIEAGARVVEAQRQSGVFVMVGYHKRSDPATLYAKQTIETLKSSGELGRMKFVRIVMPPGDWIAGGFADLIRGEDAPVPLEWDPPAQDMDEGTYKEYLAFVNYYIHQVNLMRYLLGEPYRVEYADPAKVLLVGRSDSGIPCAIEMAPYATSIDWQESALATFERGFVRLDLPAPLAANRCGRVEVFRDPGQGAVPTTTIPQFPWIHAMRQQAVNFLAAVRGERPPPCEAAEALEDLKVARSYIRLLKGV